MSVNNCNIPGNAFNYNDTAMQWQDANGAIASFLSTSGYSSAACCNDITLTFNTQTPLNTTINIGNTGTAIASCCGGDSAGTLITIQNDSYYPIKVSANNVSGYLMPSNGGYTCSAGSSQSSVIVGPNVNIFSPLDTLCQTLGGPTQLALDNAEDYGINSIDDCLGDVECAQTLFPDE